MRSFIRFIDSILRRVLRVVEFTDDRSCVLRLQITTAKHRLDILPNPVQPGEPVVEIHLWNEHMPPIPPEGPTLAWAANAFRLFVRSLGLAAGEMQADLRYNGFRAIGFTTGVLAYGDRMSGERFMQRLGFQSLPCRSPLGSFGDFWENLYSSWLMEAFNPGSLKPRKSFRLRRSEMWMPAEVFLKRYARPAAVPDAADRGPGHENHS